MLNAMRNGQLVGREDEAISHCVHQCATDDYIERCLIINAERDVVWEFEADTKVDEDDLTYPVIVHMRGGTISSDGVAIVVES